MRQVIRKLMLKHKMHRISKKISASYDMRSALLHNRLAELTKQLN